MNLRIPVSWLREYLKTDVAVKTIAGHLSLAGPTVEKIEKRKNDQILHIEVTSNRIDAFSVFGLAREIQAILASENLKSELVQPKGLNLELEPDVSNLLTLEVIIKDPKLCPRFTAIIIDNVKIKSSPAFIKNRLERSGIRSINNIVDISNYLMMELGQPMHTFDFDKIKNSRMILRTSEEGEKIVTLDGQMRKLPKGAIVIEDQGRLIDLCGIMGGANSQITARTKRVVLFVQAYDPLTIRKTTQALAFRTEAATRFERGIDLEGIVPALSRAVYLAKMTSGVKIASELTDIVNFKSYSKPISLNLNKLNSYLGINIPTIQALKILQLLGFITKSSAQTITATAPSWRVADIQDDVDLIEEIARIYGYHRLPSKLPEGPVPEEQEVSNLEKVIELKKTFKIWGFTEIVSYSIISQKLISFARIQKGNIVELINPLSSDWQVMRPTLLISLAEVIAKNQALTSQLKIFEIAKTYLGQKDNLPKQDLMLSITIQNGNFYQIKGAVENIFEILHYEVKFQNLIKENALFEKNESARIIIGETEVGTFGILNSQLADYFKIENPVAACEINLSIVYGLPIKPISYKSTPKYPPVIEDISAIFDKYTLVGNILAEIKKTGSPLVNKVEILDTFEDEKIGKDKKSVTVRLTYQRPDRTLTQEEITTVREKIFENLIRTFSAIIRR